MEKHLLLSVMIAGMAVGLAACGGHTHKLQHVDAKDPTCVAAGNVEYYHCSDCNKNYSDKEGKNEVADVVKQALGHNMSKVDAVAGTDCQHKGTIEHYHCSRCEKNFSDNAGANELASIEGPVGAHKLTHHDAVEGADCQHKGTIEYWDCSVCSKKFSDAEGKTEITSIEGDVGKHTYFEHVAVTPTCKDKGNNLYYTCSVKGCDKIFDSQKKEISAIPEIPARAHVAEDLTFVACTATCTEAGEKEHYHCGTCGKNFSDSTGTTEITDLHEDALGHLFTDYTTTDPTTSAEGSKVADCDRGCGTQKSYKILKRPANLALANKTLSWDAVDNAESYIVLVGEVEAYSGTETSVVLNEAQIRAFMGGTDIIVRGVTTDDEYAADVSGSVVSFSSASLGENLQANANPGFENTKLERPANCQFAYWPYANYSAGHYFIEKDGATNTALKIPAVVWNPGCTEMKKGLAEPTRAAGTYEISFDIKASQKSLEAFNPKNNKYGTIKGYMNCAATTYPITIGSGTDPFDGEGGGLVVKDIPGISTSTYTNVRLRYTIPELNDALCFNLIYWPEGYIGEDNFVWVDNIQIFKVEEGVVGTENMDAGNQGDLEGEDYGFTDNFAVGSRWYNARTIYIENSSVGSEIITEEGGNRCLKVYANQNDTAFDLFGNVAMKSGGIYKMSMKLKCGTAYAKHGLDCTAWRNDVASDVTQFYSWFGFNLSAVNSEEWVTVESYFYCPDYADLVWFNIFINMNNNEGAASSDPNNYLLFDDISMQAVSFAA